MRARRPAGSRSGRRPDRFAMSSTVGASASFDRTEAMGALLARNWWLVLLRGGLAVLFGLVALLLPGITLASLVLVFAAYMLADGVLAIGSAVKAASRHERSGALVLE